MRVKGWLRFKGTANVNNTPDGTLIAYSLPFYMAPPPPTLTSLSPTHGNPGDVVTVGGRFDGATSAPVSLTLMGNAVTILEKSESQIKFAVPSVRATGDVQVKVDGSASNTLTYQIDPRIESISPEHPIAGQITTITGYGLSLGGPRPRRQWARSRPPSTR